MEKTTQGSDHVVKTESKSGEHWVKKNKGSKLNYAIGTLHTHTHTT